MSSAWMAEALSLARQAAAEDEVPVGAVVIASPDSPEARIVGRGYNRREQDQQPGAHAETIAIAEAARALGSWRLSGCLLVATLEPCPMCLATAQQARIAKLVYGALDAKGGALSLGYRLHEDERTNHRFLVEAELDAGCEAILKTFFREKRFKKMGERK